MPAFGWQELLIVLLIVLIVFGAGKLSGVGEALGRSVRDFRAASREPDDDKPLRDEPQAETVVTTGTLSKDGADTK
jgi:sec-independent protein translocase protein TatA